MENQMLIELTAEIVATHVANNEVPVSDVSGLITTVYAALARLDAPIENPEPQPRVTAATIRASVKPTYIVCLECGRRQMTLKKHLNVAHGLRPQGYRDRFGLAPSYPMMAPEYSARRKEMAHAMWLGRKPDADATPGARPSAPPRGRRRTKAVAE